MLYPATLLSWITFVKIVKKGPDGGTAGHFANVSEKITGTNSTFTEHLNPIPKDQPGEVYFPAYPFDEYKSYLFVYGIISTIH
jgi:hypothetical protein